MRELRPNAHTTILLSNCTGPSPRRRDITGGRRLPRAPLSATALALLVAPLGHSSWAEEVSNAEDLCVVIAAYDKRPAVPSTLEAFEHMVFSAEGCVDPADCSLDELTRLSGPIQVVPTLETSVSGERREKLEEAVRAALGYSARFLEEGTGLSTTVSQDADPAAAHRLFVIMRDAGTFEAAARDGEPPSGDDFPVTDAFELGIREGRSCFVEPYFDAEGRRADAAVYVTADQPIEDVSACIKAELFNATGVGGVPPGSGALFEDPWGRVELPEPYGQSFSVRDAALLQLLHLPDLRPGQDRDAVMATLRAWKEARCAGE